MASTIKISAASILMVIYMIIFFCSYTHAQKVSKMVCKWDQSTSTCEKDPTAMIELLTNTKEMFGLLMRCQYATTQSTCNNMSQNTCTWKNNACRISSKKLIDQIDECFYKEQQQYSHNSNIYKCKQELKNISDNYSWIDQNLVSPATSCKDTVGFFSQRQDTCMLIKYAFQCSYNCQKNGNDQMQAYQLVSNIRYVMGKNSMSVPISTSILEYYLNIQYGNLQQYDRCNTISSTECRNYKKKQYDYQPIENKNNNNYISGGNNQDKKSGLNVGIILGPIFVCLFLLSVKSIFCCRNVEQNVEPDVEMTERTTDEERAEVMPPAKTSDLLRSLPNMEFKNSHGQYSSEVICCICLESLQEGDASTNLSCAHLFHKNCLNQWIKRQGRNVKCPLCNQKIQTNNTEQQNQHI